MDPAARLLRLLSLLQDREWAATELAERLGVTSRTIRRDVARLRDLGYRVDITPGRIGYRLGVGRRLPPLLLDDDEAFAVVHGLRLAATAPVDGAEEAALAALRKIDQILPSPVRERVRALDAATVHVDLGTAPAVSADTLAALASACRFCERVTFTYEDFRTARSARRVDPLRLVHVGRRWYLVGHDADRHDWRTFRVDRITDVNRTGHTFTRTNAPDAARRVLEGLAVVGRPATATVLVDVEPDDARRRYSTFGAIEPTDDNRSILHLRADTLAQIARSIASMSCTWRVLEPVELLDELRTHTRGILAQVETSTRHMRLPAER